MKYLYLSLLSLLAVYLLVLLFIYFTQRNLLYHPGDNNYLDDKIQKMIDTINSTNIPNSHESCNNCAYTDRRNEIEWIKEY